MIYLIIGFAGFLKLRAIRDSSAQGEQQALTVQTDAKIYNYGKMIFKIL